jgi:hypothetical protein
MNYRSLQVIIIIFLVGTMLVATVVNQSPNSVTDSDMAYIIDDALHIAISSRMPDHTEITYNKDYIIISSRNLNENWVPSSVGGYTVLLMTPEQLQAKADREGIFSFLSFDEIKIADGRVEFMMGYFPILPSGSTLMPLYGGGLWLKYVESYGQWNSSIIGYMVS